MTTDGELLRRYTETNSESAFTELVERHLALVYSAALRQVNGDAHLAQDVAQTVFTELARKAGSLANRPVLTGWFYTSAHFAAVKAVRTERRRHAHEGEAQIMNQLLSDPTPDLDWEKLRPVLDAVMLELNETDREAVLLRYFDNRPHADIADRLGLSENGARMRVERALEKLHALLSRRGVSTTAALSAVISDNAVQVAPAGLAASLSTAALVGTTLATTATTKAIAMTTLQKTVIVAALATAVGTGIYETRQAARLRSQVKALQEQQVSQAGQIDRMNQAWHAATNQIAGLLEENERLKRNPAELLKLRGDNTRLRAVANQALTDPTQAAAQSWIERVNKLKQRFEQTPETQIPEMQLLDEEDWLAAVKDRHLDSNADYRQAMSAIRMAGENKLAPLLRYALYKYLEANADQFPTDVSQLKPYFQITVEDAILQRYAILPAKEIPVLPMGGDWIITEKEASVDDAYDLRIGIGPKGYGRYGPDVLYPAKRAFAAANNGQTSTDASQLLPYAKTPEAHAEIQRIIQNQQTTVKQAKKPSELQVQQVAFAPMSRTNCAPPK